MPDTSPNGSAGHDGWLAVIEAAQQQMADAHSAFQQAMTESHQIYLRTAEATLTGLLGLATGQPSAPSTPPAAYEATAADARPPAAALAGPAPQPSIAATPQPAADPLPRAVRPAPPEPRTPEPTPAEPAAPEPTAPEPAALDADAIGAALLAVVADRTGYPVEMLNADMDLETDIGIDSIKRVDVLSALREQIGAEAMGAGLAEFAGLRTVRAIAEKAVGHDAAPPATVGTEAAPDVRPAGAPRTVGLRRYVPRAVDTPPAGIGMPGLAAGPVAVTDEGTGIAPLVVDSLRGRGIEAAVVPEVPAGSRNVVLLDGLRAVASVDDAVTANRTAFRAARQAATAMDTGGVFVTVQNTGGSFAATGSADGTAQRAWLGGLSALARTAAAEWPQASVKAIDIEPGDRAPELVATAIVDELVAGGPSIAVGLRADGSRITLGLDESATRPGRSAVGPNSVIVATGGARGITAVALRALAERHRPRLVLLGRRPLVDEPDELRTAADEASLIRALAERDGPASGPAETAAAARDVLAQREIRQTLAALERSGAQVRYLPVDVRDGTALAAALDEVRGDWGPITGVIHGAGVLADSLLVDKTDDQFARAFGTKVDGLRALLAATADDPLELLCVFSSVTAYAGNPGQADYAMANEVLNQVLAAEQTRRRDCLVRAVGWGPWRAGMMTDTLAERLDERGWALIDPDAGAEAFLAELEDAGPDVRVVLTAGDTPVPVNGGDGFTGDIAVAAPEYAYLNDHQVGGAPVVPVATVIDWFVGAARSWRPGAGSAVLHDVQVLNKIALPRLSDGGHLLVLRGHQSTGPTGRQLDLDLRGDEDLPHYRASVGSVVPARDGWDAPTDLAAPPVVYDGVTLFHGPLFQALDAVRIGTHGAEATVVGAAALGWTAPVRGLDEPAVDGCLQLAVLWAQQAGCGATLPMAVRECRVHRFGPITEPVRCVVVGRQVDDAIAECDIGLLDADGTARLELVGVRLVRRPD